MLATERGTAVAMDTAGAPKGFVFYAARMYLYNAARSVAEGETMSPYEKIWKKEYLKSYNGLSSHQLKADTACLVGD